MSWRIGELLVQKKWISWEQLQDVLEIQKSSKKMLGEILCENKLITRFYLYQILAQQSQIEFVDLPVTRINPHAIDLLPMEFAMKHEIIPIDIVADALILGISNPINHWPETEVRKMTRMDRIQTVLCLPEEVKKAILKEYNHVDSPNLQAR